MEMDRIDNGRVEGGGEEAAVAVDVWEDERGTSGGRLDSGPALTGEVKGDSTIVDGRRLVLKENSEGRCEIGGVGREEGVDWGEAVRLGGYEC